MNTENVIHETAVVEHGVQLGRGISVGPFAYIQANASVGDGCMIGPHVSILGHTTLGNNCKVHAGAVLGDLPQDLAFTGCESRVVIGANCIIREGVTIHRGTKPGTATEVGDDCFLMAFSHLAHNVKLGRDVILANGALLGGYVEVGDKAFISGNAVVHQFVRIGRLAMMGGLSGVSKDVPPFCMVRSHAVNCVVGLNVVGMRRAGIKPDERKDVRRAFKILYCSGRNVSQATQKIREIFTSGLPLEFCEFIEQSKRGICAFVGDPMDASAVASADTD